MVHGISWYPRVMSSDEQLFGRTGYFFDRRQASPTGEWSIYPLCLDGPQDEDPPADDEMPDPSTIEAFGS